MENQEDNKYSKTILVNEIKELGFNETAIQQAMQRFDKKQEIIEYLISLNQKQQVKQIDQISKDEDYESCQQQYKMVFLVRMDLKLSLGKIAEYVATAALSAYRKIEMQVEHDEFKEVAFYEWTQNGQKKIVLKCNSEKQIIELKAKIQKKNINYIFIKQYSSRLKKQQNNLKKNQINRQSLDKQKSFPQKQIQETNLEDKQEIILAAFGPVSQTQIDPLTKQFKLF